MALLQKLKEKLGIGGSSERTRTDTEVTVERETGDGAETGDDAGTEGDVEADIGAEPVDDTPTEFDSEPVDGTETGGDAEPDVAPEPDVAAEPEGDGVDEPVATETEASASTESLVDEEPDHPDEAAEPAEAAGPPSGDADVVDDDAGSVDSIKGIGPAYAERLGSAGIHTVADLAEADASSVADGANVGEKRAQTWIDRAKEF